MQDTARDRLLLAAAQLLEESGPTASTRAICQRAGVTAPTLYHHFGSKDGLIDAVINYGFSQYVADGAGDSDDPVADLRRGWDRHVQFGLSYPSFYALLYGRVRPGVPCAITAPAQARLTELLHVAARQGWQRIPVHEAAAQILAANVGVTLSLIAQPEDARDLSLSEHVRDTILAATVGGPPTGPSQPTSRAATAVALQAALRRDGTGLSTGEAALLDELLDRLSQPQPS